jgi:CDP-paratose 2-epimerase
VDQNLGWLTQRHGDRVHPVLADVRDLRGIEAAFTDAKAVFHLAAQTAVTTSLVYPIDDFETNARGTINVLESVRKAGKRAPVIFASTNKVYGALEDVAMLELDDRYIPSDEAIRAYGIGEDRPINFCTPYGCSKGVADQYVLDYAKSYDLPTAVLRMSCIYGPRQFGTEDQGWVAHFLIRALAGQEINMYGDGKQVRDILHVDDAVSAYRTVLSGDRPGQGQSLQPRRRSPQFREHSRRLARDRETHRPIAEHEVRRVARRRPVLLRGKHPDTGEPTGLGGKVHWRNGLQHLAEWLADNRFGGRSVLRKEMRKVSA